MVQGRCNSVKFIDIPLGGFLYSHTHQGIVKKNWDELASIIYILPVTISISNIIYSHTTLAAQYVERKYLVPPWSIGVSFSLTMAVPVGNSMEVVADPTIMDLF